MHAYEVLKRPVTTEKSSFLSAHLRQYAFEVDKTANKLQIKDAVQKAFSVKVVSVHVMTVPGKPRRWGRHETQTAAWRKAIVTLASGDSISFFEGV